MSKSWIIVLLLIVVVVFVSLFVKVDEMDVRIQSNTQKYKELKKHAIELEKIDKKKTIEYEKDTAHVDSILNVLDQLRTKYQR